MRKASILLLIACALSISLLFARRQAKPWMQWSEQDAKKILADSPWAQTLEQIDAPEMFPNAGQYIIIPKYGDPSTYSKPNQKVGDFADSVNYYVRFLSARPIREALVRVAQLRQQKIDPEFQKEQRDFIDSKFDRRIVVTITFACRNQRYFQPVMHLFNGGSLSTLKNIVFLELEDGRRVFLEDYNAPGADGLGAKFMFPRYVNGTPFITAKSKSVRFFAKLTRAEASRPLIFNMRFKVSDFMYDGVLEF